MHFHQILVIESELLVSFKSSNLEGHFNRINFLSKYSKRKIIFWGLFIKYSTFFKTIRKTLIILFTCCLQELIKSVIKHLSPAYSITSSIERPCSKCTTTKAKKSLLIEGGKKRARVMRSIKQNEKNVYGISLTCYTLIFFK